MTLHITVTVIGSHDIKKDIEKSRTINIIQHNNSMLTLWQIHIL